VAGEPLRPGWDAGGIDGISTSHQAMLLGFHGGESGGLIGVAPLRKLPAVPR
jgi:hypothetical protein